MYYIVFYNNYDNDRDVYSGGSYIHQGEKYACIDGISPKLFKSEKTARNSAEKLIKSCVNIGNKYEILEYVK